jgi:hypothetical protein
MALGPGARLGPYEITAQIGAGGMGEVYHARDTKLGRDVALKMLPDAFANDPERLARFEREARTLAALNDPHIAQVYGFEESERAHALVMELVDGEDLAQRVTRGPVPLDEAVSIAKQIAEALEDDGRDDSRNRRLHGARAGKREACRQACGYLGLRLRPLRDALRPTDLRRGRDRVGRDRRGDQGGARLEGATRRHTAARAHAARAVPAEGPEAPSS